jgi:hypothetical protein
MHIISCTLLRGACTSVLTHLARSASSIENVTQIKLASGRTQLRLHDDCELRADQITIYWRLMYVYFSVHALVGPWGRINLRPELGAPINQIKNSITIPDEFFTALCDVNFSWRQAEKCAELICHFSSLHLNSMVYSLSLVLLSHLPLLQFNPYSSSKIHAAVESIVSGKRV